MTHSYEFYLKLQSDVWYGVKWRHIIMIFQLCSIYMTNRSGWKEVGKQGERIENGRREWVLRMGERNEKRVNISSLVTPLLWIYYDPLPPNKNWSLVLVSSIVFVWWLFLYILQGTFKDQGTSLEPADPQKRALVLQRKYEVNYYFHFIDLLKYFLFDADTNKMCKLEN